MVFCEWEEKLKAVSLVFRVPAFFYTPTQLEYSITLKANLRSRKSQFYCCYVLVPTVLYYHCLLQNCISADGEYCSWIFLIVYFIDQAYSDWRWGKSL